VTAKAKRKRVHSGTTIHFSLSEAATVVFGVQRTLPGRRSGRSCVAPSRRLRHAAHCARTQLLGSFARTAAAGAGTVAFSGRLAGGALAVGAYTLTATPTDRAHNKGRVQSAAFAVVKG
jgi:hypothetical protein